MTIQQNFPGIMPSLNLNFAKSKRLDQRVTFQRLTGATVTNELGLIERVGNNIPRFDHSYDSTGAIRSLGLLIEEQRENLISNSENFDTWTKPGTPAGASISQDVTSSPDGNNTADKIVETNTTGGHGIWIGFTLPSTTTYTFSVFLKAAERTWVDVRGYNPTNGNQFIAKIDLINGVFLSNTTGTVRLDEYLNGWWRFSGIGSFNNIYTQFFIAPIISNASASDNSYTGDGTSGVFVWGAQLEVGAFPTSYIPTQGLPVTRLADRATIDGENFSSWYNQVEGTYFISTKIAHTPNPNVAMLFKTSADGGARVSIEQTTSNTIISIITNSGSFTFQPSGGGILPQNEFRKSTLSYISSNGTTTVGQSSNLSTYVDNTSSIDVNKSMHTLYLGRFTDTAYYLNGHIQQFVYYPRKITNNQLQQLTR